MTPTVVFDIDGTLADCDHRRHFVAQYPKDWDAFFAAMDQDPPKREIVWLAKVLIRTKAASIVFCTGRGEEYREQTEAWLKKWVTDDQPMDLRMRPAADNRPDDVIKQEILDRLRGEDRYILFTVDDRQRVVDMWRRNGITCLQCAPGDWNPITQADVTGKTVLTLMVGPSGAGKSTYVYSKFPTSQVLSSDNLRGEMTGDFADLSMDRQVFAYIHDIVRTRAAYGLHTVIDATHLHRKDRLNMVSLVPSEAKVQYIVVDRPLEEKLKHGGWRLGVTYPQRDGSVINLVEKHHQSFKSQEKEIMKGDGLPNVEVVDMRKKGC